MSAQDKDTKALLEGEELAAAAEAGELVFGEPVDAETVLPSTADEDPFVVTTVRLRMRQRKRAEAEARKRGIDLAELIRGWVDEGLAEVEDDYQVSAADLKRVLAGLRRTA
ncbi:hypothetical protein [Nocardia barduliensis]|uniref:hypothetical protein n=1 Tax=Nocardia barduliensis TaxID=2736643 RepID=UPI00157301AA|nr:hypothetical protein [Nocardia barduliensis]